MNDVIVIGAGPAGLYSAMRLAAEGFEVVVLEEHAALGVPTHCTGLVSAEVQQLYKIPEQIVLQRPTRCRVVAPRGASADFTTPGEEILVIDRAEFDTTLAEAAEAAGSAVLKGRRVARILGGVSHVDVLTDDGGHVRGRCAIIATGVGYRFHQAIGSRAPAVLHTAQLEVAAAPADVLEVHLGRELAPQGFAWLVPVRRPTGSYVKAGVLLRGDARAHLHAFLRRPDIRRRLDEEPGEPVRRLLPVGPVRRSYGERVLAVGDAAGLTKPVTGGGIFYSLLSASMAAETLIDALGRDDLRAERLARYETRWRARLGPELRAGIWFRRLLGNLSDAELERFVGAAASSDVQAVVASMARFNWHRAAIRAVIRQPGMKSILLRCLFR